MSALPPCLVLAGGLGTRLRSVLGERLPKALAPVQGQPFLDWLLKALARQGVTEVIISVGHGREEIAAWLASRTLDVDVTLIEEHEPLGTGGAIAHALRMSGAPQMIVMNGDTITDVNVSGLAAFFSETGADLVIAATEVADASRYGALNFDASSGRLSKFEEKQAASGFINAGVYLVDASRMLSFDLPVHFSFEKDFLHQRATELDIRIFPEVREFIDIGVPADYQRAQTVIPQLVEKKNGTA